MLEFQRKAPWRIEYLREAYIRAVLSKEVADESSISEILFRDEVLNSGLSNDERNRLFSEARERSDKERSPSKNR
jgi:hypothetical protein